MIVFNCVLETRYTVGLDIPNFDIGMTHGVHGVGLGGLMVLIGLSCEPQKLLCALTTN
jgi:hypothetical protein